MHYLNQHFRTEITGVDNLRRNCLI